LIYALLKLAERVGVRDSLFTPAQIYEPIGTRFLPAPPRCWGLNWMPPRPANSSPLSGEH